MNETEDMEIGYYWALVKAGGWETQWSLEVIGYRWLNEYAAWDETEEREYCWDRSGSEIPLHTSEFKLLPNSGPLLQPTIPVDFELVKAIDPHPKAVEMLEHVSPIRDNGSD